MAITFIGSNIQDSAGAQSLTFTIPGAAAQDDFMVACVKQSENTGGQIWDDDGGGGNGWIRLAYNRTTSGRDQETALYWKVHDGSEPNPTFTWNSGGTNEPMSGSLLVYRGTDLTTPIQDFGFREAPNDANPPNPSVNVGNVPATLIVFHAATHDDISAVAAPTGYTLRTQVWSGTANDHRNHFTADLIGDNTLGVNTPPDWQHSVLNTTPEYHTYTIALQEPVVIAVDDFNTTEKFNFGDTGIVLTGFGFSATNVVELWSDSVGTVKVAQTVTNETATSITIDTVQGALTGDGILFVVVTNNTSDESAPFQVIEGLIPPNQQVIDLIKPDHYWRLNNVFDDTGVTGPVRNMTNGVVGTWTFGAPIVSGNTHSMNMDNANNRREIADSANMNITISSQERTLSFWVVVNGTQHALAAFWKEGGGVQNLAALIGYGNQVLWQLADVAATRDNVQAWSDIRLTPGRPYLFTGQYSHLESPGLSRLLLDAVVQSNSDGNPMTIGIFDSHSGDVTWNNPDNNLETAATDIAYLGQEDTQMSDFLTCSDNSTGPNAGYLDETTEIRDILFRPFAPPDDIIVSDTEANMQIALDATLDVRRDWPLSYRIEAPTGQTDLTLILNNKVFDSRITDHLDWRGTGTLTLINAGTSNIDDARVYSATGSSFSVIDRSGLTVAGLQPLSEVRYYEAGTTTEITGVESTSGSFSGEIPTESISNVDISILSLGFQDKRVKNVDVSGGDVTIPAQQVIDRQYGNA